MLLGPVFTRDAITVPRRARLYVVRTAYVCAFGVLMYTAWAVLTGNQLVRNIGDFARYGAIVFQLLAALQLALAVFFSALFAAGAVNQEKDRRTLVLLLLTRMSNSELVLGKLFSSLLLVMAMLAAAFPFFMSLVLFGGISLGQIARVYAITLVAALTAGSLGSTIAFWRDKTFQTLALVTITLLVWLGVGEVLALGWLDEHVGQNLRPVAEAISPWQAVLAATRPALDITAGAWWGNLQAYSSFVPVALFGAVFLNGLAIARLRPWNATQDTRPREQEAERASIWGLEHEMKRASAVRESGQAQKRTRPNKNRVRDVWKNPILWREIRTWAYGRKIILIRATFVVLAMTVGLGIAWMASQGNLTRANVTWAVVPLLVVSLLLVNAQAVTSITTERDGRALDMLLVTDLTPKEFVFGKLGGVFYNAKETILLPVLLCSYIWWIDAIGLENVVYLSLGLAVMYCFVAVLGIHAGMAYASSRSAILVSLGTLFFLLVGVATCMQIMVAFSGSFEIQLQPFLALMFGGGIGLYVALGVRNPSSAIAWASFGCPFAMFYSITSYFVNAPLAVFLVTSIAYGFATAAMLVPAIFEFDIAMGRAVADEE